MSDDFKCTMAAICFADKHGPRSNYGKDHKFAMGLYDGNPRASCVYCGVWFDVSTSDGAL